MPTLLLIDHSGSANSKARNQMQSGLRRSVDVFLAALWVFLYAVLIRVFRALKQLEEARGRRRKEAD